MTLTFLGAFLGGALTLLSPCSVMLLPAFFAYAFNSPGALVARTGLFFLGLATSLVPLGLLAGTLGAWVSLNRETLMTVASILVIVLGAVMVLGIRIPALTRQRGAKSASMASAYALGTVYGLAGVCAGPLLGAALTLSMSGGNALMGGLVMLLFAAGMALPLFVLSLLWERVPAIKNLVRPRELVIGKWRNAWTNVVGGCITIAIGVLLLVTKGTSSLGSLIGYSTQASLEAWVQETANAIPNWLFVIVMIVIVGVWFAIWQPRRAERIEAARAAAEDQG